ncbi:MAG: transketolase [Thermodesulfobacteriota bacterium]|jgi:transketolase
MTIEYSDQQIRELEQIAVALRRDSLRMIYQRQAGHPGGSLSAADIMAVLYFNTMRIDPQNPDWPDRDRFILSKGHASALLYSTLARRGFFPASDLDHWGELTCHLQGHPDRLKTPGVDMTSGILGHGIAVGAGLALAANLQSRNYRVYVLLGDGECQGGIVWEGINACAKFGLANLTAIVDYNKVQLDGPVQEIMPMEPFNDKWRSFRWNVIEIDGHSIGQILASLDQAHYVKERPSVIIANTIKGKGVSFMENKAQWHGIAPNKEQFEAAMTELGGRKQIT